ncbi:MAG: putative secreted protein [Myxococcales bacterium]|nr:putative secreted protein [Myxococcales bacterium]
MNRLFLIAAITSSIAGCAAKATYVAGTRVPYSNNNKSVLDAVEEYRLAVERADAEALMVMAHRQYWEDSGTPSGSDDYGFEGLRTVLANRLKAATEIRYSLRYMGVSQECKGDLQPGCKATVDVLIDASFTIQNVLGKPSRPDKRDQNQLMLEWDGRRWLFLAGM